jgi:hypothetical protein
MKLKFLLPFFLATIFLVGSVQAQSDFNSFWTKFKTAVVAGDKAGVANLTSFPLSMPFGVKDIRSKADFIRRYDKIINMEANAKRCFQAVSPEKQGNRYEIYCTFKGEPESSDNRPILYYFTKTKSGWKFAGLDNINE